VVRDSERRLMMLANELIDRYLNVRFGMVWTDLKDIQVPLRVGDVVILPGSSNLLQLTYQT
jgi:hypothetical protein